MTVEAQKALFLLVLLVIAVLASRKPGKEKQVIDDVPDAIVIVPPVGIGASAKVDAWAKDNGLELRRYDIGVNLDNAEPWVAKLYELAKEHTPAAVVCIQGNITIIEIDENLCKHLEALT